MDQVMEFYIDAHRKAIVNKIGNSMVVAIIDSTPQVLKRDLYEEIISFREIDIAKRRLSQEKVCEVNRHRYTVIEEALCLKNQENCIVISYIINIECADFLTCKDEEIINLIKCLASAIKA